MQSHEQHSKRGARYSGSTVAVPTPSQREAGHTSWSSPPNPQAFGLNLKKKEEVKNSWLHKNLHTNVYSRFIDHCPLEKEMATCPSIHAWKILWTEEP